MPVGKGVRGLQVMAVMAIAMAMAVMAIAMASDGDE